METLDDLKMTAFIAHQHYLQAAERGKDQIELMRLWVAFLDATKAVSKAKAEGRG